MPAVLRGAGCQVVEVDGWQTRGRELDAAHAVVVHDTVTTDAWSDAGVDALLVRGRTDVPGPLAQLGVDRQGRFRLIASGRANHAGYSVPWGNSSVGIEVYCAGGLKGREERWNAAQYAAVTAGARAILDRLGHDTGRLVGHKEVDTRGKIDPYGIDMDQLRRDVAAGRPLEEQTMRQGDKGADVAAWQHRLKTHAGIDVAVDGDFGPATVAATVAWQKRAGIEQTGTVTLMAVLTLGEQATDNVVTRHAKGPHGGEVDLSGLAPKGHTHEATVTVR